MSRQLHHIPVSSNKLEFCNSNVNLFQFTPPLVLVLKVKPQMTKQ